MRRFNLLVAVLLCAAIISHAQLRTQPHKPLLGPAAEGVVKFTPKYRISYVANDFDRPRRKRIAKTENYLRRHHMPEALINEFKDYADKLSDPSYIPNAIDTAWDAQKALWQSCGQDSKSARVAASFDPRTVKIIIEPVAFFMPSWGFYANGDVEGDGKTIRAVAVGINYFSKPESAQLVRFDALARWEFGNALSMKANWKIKTVNDEIGDGSPCTRIHD